MTEILKKAFAEAAKLPEREQRQLAEWLMEELRAERRWEDLLGASGEQLERLGDEALDEHRSDRTESLDPYRL